MVPIVGINIGYNIESGIHNFSTGFVVEPVYDSKLQDGTEDPGLLLLRG
jgi:hypothetical protein